MEFGVIVIAVMTANALTAMAIYGFRAIIRNEADMIGYMAILLPAMLLAGGAIAFL